MGAGGMTSNKRQSVNARYLQSIVKENASFTQAISLVSL